MILLEVPNWFAQLFGIGLCSIAFVFLFSLGAIILNEFFWKFSWIYRTMFYAMWAMKGEGDSFELTTNGKKTKWRRVE